MDGATVLTQGGERRSTPLKHRIAVRKTSQGILATGNTLDSPESLMQFFKKSCNPPSLKISIRGSHVVDDGKDDQYSWWTQPASKERVQDFAYAIDLASYVIPFGYMQSAKEGQSLEATLDGYIKDTSPLKELTMQKFVDWPFEQTKSRIEARMRDLGYTGEVDVRFLMGNSIVCVHSDSKIYEWTHGSRGQGTCLSCMFLPFAPKPASEQFLKATFRTSITLDEWWEKHERDIRVTQTKGSRRPSEV